MKVAEQCPARAKQTQSDRIIDYGHFEIAVKALIDTAPRSGLIAKLTPKDLADRRHRQ